MFYGRLFDLELRGRAPGMAFVDMGDQFLALGEGRSRPPDAHRHFGLVVDDKEAVRRALEEAGVEILRGRGLDFRDPWGNRVEVVDYRDVQFTKAPQVLGGMGLDGLAKSERALDELRQEGAREIGTALTVVVPTMATTFDRARRRSAYAHLARVLGRAGPSELLPLDEATRRLRPFAHRYIGLRPVPLAQVVGTDSRADDFDRDFHPRRPHLRGRWQQVEQAYPDADFPPIVVYQLGDAYFVVDGHHRVAIAREKGMETIDAEVTELQARWHLPADADIVELIHAEQERIFMDESGLGEIHPELGIRFARPVGYIELLETVQLHGYHLMREAGLVLPSAGIARSWYETVYEPTIEVIHAEGLDEAWPEATDPDRFLWIWERRRELMPEVGCRPLDETARRVTAELARERRRAIRRTRRLQAPQRPEGEDGRRAASANGEGRGHLDRLARDRGRGRPRAGRWRGSTRRPRGSSP